MSEAIRCLGVFLNGSPADETVLQFTRCLAGLAQAGRVHFIHYREKGIADQRPDPEPKAFEERVRAALPGKVAAEVTCEVLAKGGIRAILQSIREIGPDLVVVGRRLPTDQMALGSTFKKLARKAPCNALVVTEYSYPHFERALIPVDFSEHSKGALRLAVALVRGAKGDHPQILLQHNVEVGYGYQYTGISFEEYARRLRENAERQMAEFLRGVDLGGLEAETVITLSADPVEAVVALAIARKMDVVVIGSQGQGSMFGALMGSTSERVLASCPLPVIVAKSKGEATEALDAMLSGGG